MQHKQAITRRTNTPATTPAMIGTGIFVPVSVPSGETPVPFVELNPFAPGMRVGNPESLGLDVETPLTTEVGIEEALIAGFVCLSLIPSLISTLVSLKRFTAGSLFNT